MVSNARLRHPGKSAPMSTILRAARRRIAEYRNDQLCHAIDRVQVGTVEEKTALCRAIAVAIAPYSSYTAWLAINEPTVYADAMGKRGAFRKLRLKWADNMIAAYEKLEVHRGAA